MVAARIVPGFSAGRASGGRFVAVRFGFDVFEP
jgi:hypothetical protein